MSDEAIRETKKVMEHLQTNSDDLGRRISNLESNTAAPNALSRVSSAVAAINTIIETTLFSDFLPGKSLLTSNTVEMEAVGLITNPSGGAVNATWKLKYNTSVLTLGPFSISSGSSLTGRLFRLYALLKAINNSEQQQKFLAELIVGSDYNVFTTAGLFRGFTVLDITQDSTQRLPITFTFQNGSALPNVGATLLMFKLGAPQVAV